MYSRQETYQLKQGFWTAFGQYMAPVRSSEGERINWINYRTGDRSIGFRMEADNKCAVIAVEIRNRDADIRQIYFDQMVQFKPIFDETMQEEWTWQASYLTDTSAVSRIYKELRGINVLDKSDWPALISFFKPRIIALDAFWSNIKYAFEALS